MKRTKTEKKKLNTYKTQFSIADKRQETLEGITYTVVPVTMMVEGVHSGSRGPMLHTAAELGKIPDAWNGRPIVIDHPQDNEGAYISANSPVILESSSVGFVFNTEMKNNKLIAEAWFNNDRLKEMYPDILTSIENDIVMEVSVGVYSEEDETPGTFNGVHYETIAYNHVPDHLAILLNAVGACSVEDGCGLLVNKENKMETNAQNEKKLNKAGYILTAIVVHEGLLQLIASLRNKIDAMDSNNTMNFLIEAYQDYVIYKVRKDGGIVEFYRQSYQVATDNSIVWVGAPAQVIENITYRPVPVVQKSNNKSKKEVKMTGKEGCPKCTEKINALIANKLTQYKEEDKEWLETLELEALEKMTPVVLKEEKKPVVNEKKSAEHKQITKEEALNALGISNPTEYEAQMKFGLGMYKAQVNKIVETVLKNTKDVWKKEELEAMPFETLQKIASSLKEAIPLVDYSLFGSPTPLKVKKEEVEPMPLAGYTFEKSKN